MQLRGITLLLITMLLAFSAYDSGKTMHQMFAKIGLVKPHQLQVNNRYALINWDMLTPPDWDAMALLKDIDLSKMQDNDPRAFDLLKEVREQWNNAPVIKSWDGHSVSLNGYLVPLDGNAEQIKEFLLVPYFGACIHSPPPPSNQIIHVYVIGQPLPLANLDAYVTVSGILNVAHSNTALGATGYQMQADIVKKMIDEAS